MSIVDPNSLRPGSRLPRSLFTRQGVKVLSSGVVLSDEMCRTLQRARWGDLYLADSAGELRDSRVLHEVAQAPAGRQAEQDLVTLGGVLAVEAGQTVEPHHAAAYELGALAGPATREDQRQRAARMKVADEYVAALASSWSTLPATIEPSSVPPPDPAQPARAWPDPAGLAAFRSERIRRFGRLFARILSGLPVPVRQVDTLVDELVELNRAHPERFTQLALLAPAPREYLAEHGYTTACLSVAIASRLGWSIDHVRLAGASGLLADTGMGLVPFELRASARPLDEVEINRVRRHPAFSVVLLEAVEGLAPEVRQAAYQHHERENGSGYPAGLRGRRIGDLARIVSVADAFAAATSMRRYRSPKRPYDAAEEMIMLGSSGLFPRRIVRSLVEAVGLFPVGSHVRLSNGSPAIVVGSHPDMIDRPIVCTLESAPGGYRMGMAVDLAAYKPWELSVIQAIDAPAAAAEAVLRQSA